MEQKGRALLRAAGIAAGAAAAASLSAYITASCFLRMAVDREKPPILRNAERLLSGARIGERERRFMDAVAAADAALAARDNETVEITARDGEKLVGHWFRREGAKRVIIGFHGWRSSWSRDFGLSFDSWMAGGCSALIVEQRGQNNSGGDYMGFGLTERCDCLDWIDWVTARCGGGIPVYLCGVSMGATTVLMAAGLGLPENVHGIIADCGFTSPRAIWRHVARDNLHMPFALQGAIAEALLRQKIPEVSPGSSAAEALRRSTTPVIFIHGTADSFVPVEMTYENYEACAGPKRLFIVPGAEHGESYFVDKEGYEAAVLAFWRDFD